MPIDWIWGLIGGGLIGIAAAIFLLVNGRIMGASGIIGGLVDGSGRNTWSERGSCGSTGWPRNTDRQRLHVRSRGLRD